MLEHYNIFRAYAKYDFTTNNLQRAKAKLRHSILIKGLNFALAYYKIPWFQESGQSFKEKYENPTTFYCQNGIYKTWVNTKFSYSFTFKSPI